MYTLKKKEKKKRIFFNKLEDYFKIVKSIRTNASFNYLMKWNLLQIQTSLSKNSSKVRASNRCIMSNRKNIIHKHFKLSRLFFLKYARFGVIYGITKKIN
jgi:ribosomal protein S14